MFPLNFEFNYNGSNRYFGVRTLSRSNYHGSSDDLCLCLRKISLSKGWVRSLLRIYQFFLHTNMSFFALCVPLYYGLVFGRLCRGRSSMGISEVYNLNRLYFMFYYLYKSLFLLFSYDLIFVLVYLNFFLGFYGRCLFFTLLTLVFSYLPPL